MNVRVSKRARAHIDRAAEWWDHNRDLAPRAFDDDLAKAFALLSTNPLIGAPVLGLRAQGVRRLHLARIRYHLYYRIRVRALRFSRFGTQAVVASLLYSAP